MPRKGRDRFAPAPSRRVPKLDLTILLGRRNQKRATPGENDGPTVVPVPTNRLDPPGFAGPFTNIPGTEHPRAAGGDKLRAGGCKRQRPYNSSPRDSQV